MKKRFISFILAFALMPGMVTYSPLAYCYNVLSRGTANEEHKDVVTALLWYAIASFDYFYPYTEATR